MTTIGVIGVGHLAGYIVPVLRRDHQVVLSPRNREQAESLAQGTGAHIARNNQAVVDASQIVLLATRPAQAAAAVSALTWRPDHTLVSLCAGLPLSSLEAGPASLARALPISAAAIGESPTCLYPDLAPLRQLLAPLGPVVVLPDEDSFQIASVPSAFYGWVHALIAETADWARDAGLPEDVARPLVAQCVRGAAGMVLAEPDRPIDDMIGTLATPGGITELGLHHLHEAGALAPWSSACAAVLARLKSTT